MSVEIFTRPRRLAVWTIETGQLLHMLESMTPEFHVVCQGLPSDARVVGVTIADQWRPYAVNVFLESESFPEIPEGCTPLQLDLVFAHVRCPEPVPA